MKNTKIALSLAFIDKNGVITELLDLKPFDLRSKTSKKQNFLCPGSKSRLVLEKWFKSRRYSKRANQKIRIKIIECA